MQRDHLPFLPLPLRLWPLGLAALALAACATDAAPDPHPAAQCTAAPATLRFNHVQMLGTHASYHVAQPVPQSKLWADTHAPLPQQLQDQGVRAFELDLHYVAAQKTFIVANRPGLDAGTTCATLGACLQQLRTWSEAHPCHHALFVLLGNGDDIDADPVADHLPALEAALLQVWPRASLLTPDDVRGTGQDLRSVVTTTGWPALAASRGQLMVALRGSPALSAAYKALHPQLAGAAAFLTGSVADADVAVVSDVEPAAVPDLVQKGYFVHAFPVPDPAAGAAALASGAQVVATDAPVPRSWLGGYALAWPGGSASRCNPVTALASCTAGAVNGTLAP